MMYDKQKEGSDDGQEQGDCVQYHQHHECGHVVLLQEIKIDKYKNKYSEV